MKTTVAVYDTKPYDRESFRESRARTRSIGDSSNSASARAPPTRRSAHRPSACS